MASSSSVVFSIDAIADCMSSFMVSPVCALCPRVAIAYGKVGIITAATCLLSTVVSITGSTVIAVTLQDKFFLGFDEYFDVICSVIHDLSGQYSFSGFIVLFIE